MVRREQGRGRGRPAALLGRGRRSRGRRRFCRGRRRRHRRGVVRGAVGTAVIVGGGEGCADHAGVAVHGLVVKAVRDLEEVVLEELLRRWPLRGARELAGIDFVKVICAGNTGERFVHVEFMVARESSCSGEGEREGRLRESPFAFFFFLSWSFLVFQPSRGEGRGLENAGARSTGRTKKLDLPRVDQSGSSKRHDIARTALASPCTYHRTPQKHGTVSQAHESRRTDKSANKNGKNRSGQYRTPSGRLERTSSIGARQDLSKSAIEAGQPDMTGSMSRNPSSSASTGSNLLLQYVNTTWVTQC